MDDYAAEVLRRITLKEWPELPNASIESVGLDVFAFEVDVDFEARQEDDRTEEYIRDYTRFSDFREFLQLVIETVREIEND